MMVVDFSKATVLKDLLEQSGVQQFLDDKDNTEIVINRPFELWTESHKGWNKYQLPKLSYAFLKQLATVFAVYNKLEISQQNPICNGVLPDGQRGQFVVPTACETETVSITIRQPSLLRLSLDDYNKAGKLDNWIDVSEFQTKNTKIPKFQQETHARDAAEIAELSEYLGIPDDIALPLYDLHMLKAKADRRIQDFIKLAVKHRKNICLVGATGSGKTTFTKTICDEVPPDTRIITIEDTAELDLPKHGNRVHMFYKDVMPNVLLKSCMRMKPDRIFLTELRGTEAVDYLEALNTGHGGSVTTVHANNCMSAFHRIASLIKQSDIGKGTDTQELVRQVKVIIDVMIFLEKKEVTQLYFDPVTQNRILKGQV